MLWGHNEILSSLGMISDWIKRLSKRTEKKRQMKKQISDRGIQLLSEMYREENTQDKNIINLHLKYT